MIQTRLQLTAGEQTEFATWALKTRSEVNVARPPVIEDPADNIVERVRDVSSELDWFIKRYLKTRGLTGKYTQAELFAFYNVLMHTDLAYTDEHNTLLIPVRMTGHFSYYPTGEDALSKVMYATFESGTPGELVVAFDEFNPHCYHMLGDKMQLAVTVGVLADELEKLCASDHE
jgi:hypothetical protein